MTSSNNKANKSVQFEKAVTKKARPLQTESKKSTVKDRQPQQAKPNKSTAKDRQPLKSDKVNEPKPLPAHPPVVGSCFKTTGFIIGDGNCVEVSHMLVDSGASTTAIHMRAVRKAKLNVFQGPPVYFSTCNGLIASTKYVSFPLCIGGIQHTVSAFIEEREDDHIDILLGITEINKFRITFHHPSPTQKDLRVSVKSDTPGQRHKHYYLRRDDPKTVPTLRVHDSRKGLRRAMRLGETGTQRKAREKLDRVKAELQEAKTQWRRLKSPPKILDSRSGAQRTARLLETPKLRKARQAYDRKRTQFQKARRAWFRAMAR